MLLVSAAVLTCSACLGETGKLEVRSVSSGLKAGHQPVPFRIAEARAHLVLGNVALALEGFRKAAREDPASVDALTGIAYCYDQMGRFDLSRRNYEMALALAPRDPALLAAFAGSLDQQGLATEAASVRREIAGLPQPAQPATELADVASEPPVTTKTAPPVAPVAAAPVGQSVTIALAAPRPVAAKPIAPTLPKAQVQLPAQPKTPAQVQAVVQVKAQAQAHPLAVAPVGRSVTIALPPARPMTAAPKPTAPAALAYRQPRLERLSLTEVALVTGSGPRWTRPTSPPPPVRAAARTAPAMPFEVRVLNAARVDKLAARTRTFLGNFGWRDIAVGDAAAVRARSLIVYPKGSQQAANRLSARLGFAMAERKGVRQVTILLGRDAAVHPSLRPKA
jgi:hypothetical protein